MSRRFRPWTLPPFLLVLAGPFLASALLWRSPALAQGPPVEAAAVRPAVPAMLHPDTSMARWPYTGTGADQGGATEVKDAAVKGFVVGAMAGLVVTVFAAQSPQSGTDILLTGLVTGAIGAAMGIAAALSF